MSKHTPDMKIERIPRLGSNILGIMNEMSANEFVATDWDSNCDHINKCVKMHSELLEKLKWALTEIESCWDDLDLETEDSNVIKSIKDVISKAEGEGAL